MTLTAEQVELRRSGLGGTDVAAIFGEVKRRSPIDVCLEKWGEAEVFDGNRRTKMGHRLEPVVAQLYAEEAEVVTCVCEPSTVRHPDRPWQLGSPDRLVLSLEQAHEQGGASIRVADYTELRWLSHSDLKPDRGLEIKTHGHWGSQEYAAELRDQGAEGVVWLGAEQDGLDTIPAAYRIQCAWYMALLDIDRWDLAALLDTHLLGVVVIERDKELEGDLLAEAERFWTQNVMAGVAPEPDGTESFRRHLAKKYKTHDAEMVEAGADANHWIAEHAAQHARMKHAEKRKDVASQHLQAMIGGHLGVSCHEGYATWKEQQGQISYKRAFEELCEAHGVSESAAELLKNNTRGDRMRVLRVNQRRK